MKTKRSTRSTKRQTRTSQRCPLCSKRRHLIDGMCHACHRDLVADLVAIVAYTLGIEDQSQVVRA